MTELGTATPMDRQTTCIDYSKAGHIIGVDCGHWHEEHVCLFDMSSKHWRCYAYPECRHKLKRQPPHNIPGRVWMYGDLVAIRYEIL